MEEPREMPKSILKLRDHLRTNDPLDEIETLLTQESVKSVTFDKSVHEKESVSQKTLLETSTQLEETQEIEQEKTISKLKCQNAEALVREETKQIVQTKVSAEVYLSYAEEKNELAEQKITRLKKEIENYTNLNEKLKQNLQDHNMQRALLKDDVKNIGEAVSILKDHFGKMQSNFTEMDSRFQVIYKNIPVRKSEIMKSLENYKSKINNLKKQLAYNDEDNQNRQSVVEDLKKKVFVLKQNIEERKDAKKKIVEQFEAISKENSIAKEKFKQLQLTKEELLSVASSLDTKLNTTFKHIQIENQSLKDELIKTKDTTEKRIQEALENKSKAENHLKQLKEELESKVESISQWEEKNIAAQEESSLLEEELSKLQDKYQSTEDNYKEKLNLLEKQSEDDEKVLEEAKNRNMQILGELNSLKEKYIEVNEQKNKQLILKLGQEHLLRIAEQNLLQQKSENEALLEKYNIVKTRNEEQTKTKDNLEEEIREKEELLKKLTVSSEERTNNYKKTIEDLEKKRAYLKSSISYFNDKLKNLKKEIEEVDKENSEIESVEAEADIEELAEELKKEREETEALLDEISSKPVGILKSPRKTPTTSPKKVKFQGIRSQSSEESLRPEKSFEDYIRKLEMAVASKKKDTPPKRPRLDFADED